MQFCFSSLNKSLMIIFVLLLSEVTIAQKATYNTPPSINRKRVRVTFEKVSASQTSYYVNYKAENIGNGIFIIDRELTELQHNGGALYPTTSQYILKPGDKKTIYNQFRVKPPVKANADSLYLKFNGLRYTSPFEPLNGKKLILGEKATTNIGPFAIKVMDYNVYSDRVYAEVKCSFNGTTNHIGNVDLSNVVVTGGKAAIVKKGDVVLSGKSYTFAINITPNGDELSIVFNNVLSVGQLQKLNLRGIKITSTSYVEPVKNKNPKVIKAPGRIAELSFADFSALKKDIEIEMNSGGNPVGMAHEFLLEKKCISTAQVIDILSVFNLDGSRLKFAKMAYPFTTDKVKYHNVIGKIEYTKNKQALEEFLEHQ